MRGSNEGAVAPWTTSRFSPASIRLLEFAAFAVAPVFFTVAMLAWAWDDGILAFDFVRFELPAAEKLYHGDSPYPGYGYPPLVAFALVPFVPVPGADILVTGLLIASVPAILWLLGVRDWRCYGVAFLWAPVFHAIQTANVTLPMMVLLALAWRWRDAADKAGVSVGIATAAKILAWPAGLWLLATRRVRAWAVACVTAAALTFGLWATLGFDGLFGYSSNLKATGASNADQSYTITILLTDLGAPRMLGRVVAIGVALAILALCAWAGVRGRDRLSYALAATACVYASPIVWLHSFAFLLLAVAVMRPRLSLPWLLPLPLILVTGTGNGDPWQTAIAVGMGLLTVFGAIVGATRDDAAGRSPGIVRRSGSGARSGASSGWTP